LVVVIPVSLLITGFVSFLIFVLFEVVLLAVVPVVRLVISTFAHSYLVVLIP